VRPQSGRVGEDLPDFPVVPEPVDGAYHPFAVRIGVAWNSRIIDQAISGAVAALATAVVSGEAAPGGGAGSTDRWIRDAQIDWKDLVT